MNMFNLENPSLVNGLKHMIEFVKTFEDDHKFLMDNWEHCVIGQYLNLHWKDYQIRTLKDLFGIDYSDILTSDHFLFSENNAYFTDAEWFVVSLFTCSIGHSVAAETWLNKAEGVLYQLQQEEV